MSHNQVISDIWDFRSLDAEDSSFHQVLRSSNVNLLPTVMSEIIRRIDSSRSMFLNVFYLKEHYKATELTEEPLPVHTSQI